MKLDHKYYLVAGLIIAVIATATYTVSNSDQLAGKLTINKEEAKKIKEKVKENKNLQNIADDGTITGQPDTDTLPNLGISYIHRDENKTLGVWVYNFSKVAVPSDQRNGTLYIYIDDMNKPVWTYSWSTLYSTAFLEGSVDGNYQGTTIQPQKLEGAHTVKACIDTTNVVKENFEKGNCTTVEFSEEGEYGQPNLPKNVPQVSTYNTGEALTFIEGTPIEIFKFKVDPSSEDIDLYTVNIKVIAATYSLKISNPVIFSSSSNTALASASGSGNNSTWEDGESMTFTFDKGQNISDLGTDFYIKAVIDDGVNEGVSNLTLAIQGDEDSPACGDEVSYGCTSLSQVSGMFIWKGENTNADEFYYNGYGIEKLGDQVHFEKNYN